MKNSINKILTCNQYVYPEILVKTINSLDLSLNEFLLIVYFFNKPNTLFDAELISKDLGLDIPKIMSSFALLSTKELINIETSNDMDGRIVELVNIDPIYIKMNELIDSDIKKEEKSNIFSIFEGELGRTISPIEFEMINGWISSNINEELIIGALKEAVYNGVNNFRYIDKIIYEWNKKGFKNMSDVKKHIEKKEETNEKKELFDYNWLDDEE